MSTAPEAGQPEPLDPTRAGWAEGAAALSYPLPALDELRLELEVARELADHSLAQRTRDQYTWHFERWRAWCAERGLHWRPDQPEAVAAHLAVLAVALEDDGTIKRDDGERLVAGAYRPSTVGVRLAALNKAARVAGLVAPGESGAVRDVIAGARAAFGTKAVRQRSAATMHIVLRMLDAIAAPPERQAWLRGRDNALLAVHRALEAGPGQLARLRWEDVTFRDDGLALLLARPSRATARDELRLTPLPGDPLCPVAGLRTLWNLAGKHSGPVFCSESGRGLSRQGIKAALEHSAGPDVAPVAALAPFGVLRDRSLLLCGWYGALRRSNVVALDWGDLRHEGGEWEVSVRRSKTDQEGVGYEFWLVQSRGSAWPCPATALTLWHGAVAAVIGGDPCDLIPDQPLYPSLSHGGRPRRDASGRLVRMAGESVNRLVQGWAGRAGLDEKRFGAHSLRAGFITEALTDRKLTIEEVQEVSRHRDVGVLMGYFRRANARQENPTRRLFGHSPTAVSPSHPATPVRPPRRREDRA